MADLKQKIEFNCGGCGIGSRLVFDLGSHRPPRVSCGNCGAVIRLPDKNWVVDGAGGDEPVPGTYPQRLEPEPAGDY